MPCVAFPAAPMLSSLLLTLLTCSAPAGNVQGCEVGGVHVCEAGVACTQLELMVDEEFGTDSAPWAVPRLDSKPSLCIEDQAMQMVTRGFILILSRKIPNCNMPIKGGIKPSGPKVATALVNKAASKCPHGREQYYCRECGGKGICQHNRQRKTCRECGGSARCEHDRLRSKCKICGGTSICVHRRERVRCKECGGAGICHHNRRKDRCQVRNRCA